MVAHMVRMLVFVDSQTESSHGSIQNVIQTILEARGYTRLEMAPNWYESKVNVDFKITSILNLL